MHVCVCKCYFTVISYCHMQLVKWCLQLMSMNGQWVCLSQGVMCTVDVYFQISRGPTSLETTAVGE